MTEKFYEAVLTPTEAPSPLIMDMEGHFDFDIFLNDYCGVYHYNLYILSKQQVNSPCFVYNPQGADLENQIVYVESDIAISNCKLHNWKRIVGTTDSELFNSTKSGKPLILSLDFLKSFVKTWKNKLPKTNHIFETII